MTILISKPLAVEHPEYYAYYLGLVPSEDLIYELEEQRKFFIRFIEQITSEKLNYCYAEGKWTVAQVIQHLIDTERIFCYRMLNFVRHGQMEIPGFNQNDFAAHVNSSLRTKQSFMDEFDALRRNTIEFLKTLTVDETRLQGKANNASVSVRSIGYMAYGHIVHHAQVIERKYL
ncbi:MAG: DinB family protein [Bacteroidetes bacterium]|nr:DinB family protein [Bacteroidota bacterium]